MHHSKINNTKYITMRNVFNILLLTTLQIEEFCEKPFQNGPPPIWITNKMQFVDNEKSYFFYPLRLN